MRDEKQVWTEQQERLLRAAQDVVNDADGPFVVQRVPRGIPSTPLYTVCPKTLEALRAIVQEISDDAVKAIQGRS